MINRHSFTVVNAILLFAQITSIAVYGAQPRGRLLTPEEGCGISNVANTKIIGGAEAKPGQYPWIALVYYMSKYFKGEPGTICGGSLITSRHILTAAHCIREDQTFVRLGAHDLLGPKDEYQDIKVVKVVKHPKFSDEFDLANDIAVLTLERDVRFTDRIRPICLPLSKRLQSRDFVGSTPYIAGWGDLEEDGNGSDVLMHLQVPVLDNSICKSLYKQQHFLLSELEFGDKALCAGHLEGGKDSCQGDSGGPLMLPILDNGTFNTYQIGIISYGVRCALQNAPGVFTKVPSFVDWIQETIKLS